MTLDQTTACHLEACCCCCCLATGCRDALLARVREVVSAHPDTMKYETRHAKDGDYKADVLVGQPAAPGKGQQGPGK